MFMCVLYTWLNTLTIIHDYISRGYVYMLLLKVHTPIIYSPTIHSIYLYIQRSPLRRVRSAAAPWPISATRCGQREYAH